LLRLRNLRFPTTSSRYTLAEALERGGQATEAASAYTDFVAMARPLINNNDNANEELISYYLGRGHDSAEALRIAQLEIAKRHDVNTLDAYAWALYRNGRYEEANIQIARALAVGVREAAMFYHAGVIAAKLHDDASASSYLNQSVELNPSSESAASAREALEKLAPASAAARGAK
jgi:Tfp pilus assembly protein PilF